MKRASLIAVALSAVASGAYTYYHTDNFGSAAAWVTNGTVALGSGGLKATSAAGGSLISNLNVPDGTSEYEVRSTLTITADGGTYIQYLRASNDALSGPTDQGTYWAVEIQNPTTTGGVCAATLGVYKRVGGSRYQIGSAAIGCRNGMVVRSVFAPNSVLTVFVDDQLKFAIQDSSILTGKPGVGARSTPTGNAVWQVQLGGLDRVAPNSVHYQTFGSSVFSNLVDLQWQGVTDDANGIGVMSYTVVRNGTTVTNSPVSTYTDLAASAQTPYNYTVYAVDFHGNYSAGTTVSVMTPPLGSVDPRRVGVRPMGTYWGAGGENIDTYSANVNFTLPLVKAVGRGGWGVGFALSYNSQNWRKDQGGTWRLGRDVGYGFGWKLLAGSITPYWSDLFTIHHYIFTDSTGAEYRLDVNTGGVWTSKESIYLSYDSNEQLVRFNDGSWWQMGALSAGVEQDTGSRYPTRMQDSNGNQVFIRYRTGTGAGWANSSARIDEIEDVRALEASNPTRYRTYSFTYNADPIPHLIGITSHIGSGENFTVEYHEDQAVSSPFSPAVSFGYFDLLRKVTFNGLSLSHQFEYSEPGSSGLTKVTLPYGGYLRWEFQDFTNGFAITKREVKKRYLAMDAGGTEKTYTFTRPPSDSTEFKHRSMTMDDDTAGARKKWTFRIDYTAAIGQIESLEEGTSSGTVMRRQDFSLSQDPAPHGRFYIGAVTTTLDPGNTVSQAQSIHAQTLDTYGNVTQSSIYDWNQLTTPARVYNNTYLTNPAHTSRYIRNRLLTSTVTASGLPITLVTNTYDGGPITHRDNIRQHDPDYNTGFATRGNVRTSTSFGRVVTNDYDIGGNVANTTDNAGTSGNVNSSSSTNYAAPSVITPNNNTTLSTSASFDATLSPTQVTAPNTAVTAFSYDTFHRPSSTTSPQGAVTNYEYSAAGVTPAWKKATTNGKWVKTTMDGLGRTVKMETGHSATTVSVVDTEYDACGCSPTGKVKKVSQPHAPGALPAAVYWTTYTYDALGRTATVQLPNNSGTMNYAYAGNGTTVTDPASKWKQFLSDAMGNLVIVKEPRPAGGTDYQTAYTYNALNKLTGVSMPRDGVTQTRTFTYNANQQLQSTTFPENGVTSYSYRVDGLPESKTDAKNQHTVYVYDAYKRMTQIQRYTWSAQIQNWAPRDCGTTTFSYDSNPYDGGFTANAQGRLAAVAWQMLNGVGLCEDFKEMYSYSASGLATKKRFRMSRDVNGTLASADLEEVKTYDNEGKVTSIAYPATKLYQQSPLSFTIEAGPEYSYTYDSMGRLNGMTQYYQPQSRTLIHVQSVGYGVAGELTGMWYLDSIGDPGTSIADHYHAESRQYNARLQLTRLTVPNVIDLEYRYSATNNNGQITSMKNHVSGEDVEYQYDSLKRLSSAVTVGPQWGLSYTYDGFGNRLTQAITKGSGPAPVPLNYSGTTNRITTSGYSYDGNGNMTSLGGYLGLAYDHDNRLLTATHNSDPAERYGYSPDNKRVYKKKPDGEELVYFYGTSGQRLGIYKLATVSYGGQWQLHFTNPAVTRYFGGKRLGGDPKQGNPAIVEDRLGSVASPWRRYYPYGEATDSATGVVTGDAFATYHRDDVTGLDYADQRYYSSTLGRFLSADPSRPGQLTNPLSWNYYSYVEGDPINLNDPRGLSSECRSKDNFRSDTAYDITCGSITGSAGGRLDFRCLLDGVAVTCETAARLNSMGAALTLEQWAAWRYKVMDDDLRAIARQELANAQTADQIREAFTKYLMTLPLGEREINAIVGSLTEGEIVGGHFNLHASRQALADILGQGEADAIFGAAKGGHLIPGDKGVRFNSLDLGHLHIKASGDDRVTLHLDLFNPRRGVMSMLGHLFVELVAGNLPGMCLDSACAP